MPASVPADDHRKASVGRNRGSAATSGRPKRNMTCSRCTGTLQHMPRLLPASRGRCCRHLPHVA